MDNKFSKTIELKIDDKNVAYYEILKCDERFFEVIKKFPDGIQSDSITLIPQLWWGDLEEAKIIILGKNPSFAKTDKGDNKQPFRSILEKNTIFYNRDKELKLGNLLCNPNYKNIGVIKRWVKVFKGFNGFNDEDCSKIKEDLNTVAIFNMFGYYKTSIDDVDVKMSHLKCENNKDILDKLAELIENNDVYLLWQGTRELWIKLFSDDEKYNKTIEKIRNAKSLNVNNWRNPSFLNVK